MHYVQVEVATAAVAAPLVVTSKASQPRRARARARHTRAGARAQLPRGAIGARARRRHLLARRIHLALRRARREDRSEFGAEEVHDICRDPRGARCEREDDWRPGKVARRRDEVASRTFAESQERGRTGRAGQGGSLEHARASGSSRAGAREGGVARNHHHFPHLGSRLRMPVRADR